MFCNKLDIVSAGVLFHNIYSFLLFSFPFPICCLFVFRPGLCLFLLIESKSFTSHYAFQYWFCDLCASTLWILTKACSQINSLVFFSTIYSLIFSTVLASLMPLMKCSFGFLSSSIHLQSAAFTYNLSIHSCTVSSLLVLSFSIIVTII